MMMRINSMEVSFGYDFKGELPVMNLVPSRAEERIVVAAERACNVRVCAALSVRSLKCQTTARTFCSLA
jgi:hypothetical protein